MTMATRSTAYKSAGTKQQRCASPTSSEATYGGSEADDPWDDIYDEVDTEEDRFDREEIATWLLCSDSQPWHSPHAEDEMEVPFTLSSVPGPLLLQLFYALLVYLHILPEHRKYPMTIPRHAPTRYPVHPPSISGGPSEWYDHAGRKVTLDEFTLPENEDDDMRYIVPPKIGTDQEPILIPVTSDWTLEKMQTHPKNTLRIYRVPFDDMVEFNMYACKLRLDGYNIRRPDDEFDCVSVIRHGYRTRDLGGKDEYWNVMSTDTVLVREVLARTARRRVPPFRLFSNLFRKNIIWPLKRLLRL